MSKATNGTPTYVAMENDEEKMLKKQYFILLFLILDIGASLSLDDELRYWPTCSISKSSRISFVSHDWMRFEPGLTKAKASFPEFLGNHVSAGESELCQSAMG